MKNSLFASMSSLLAAGIVSYDLPMTGLGRVPTDLPELDRTDDGGGAVVWALFIVAATLATVVVSIIWFW
jgi:hypothetical protein